MNIIGKWKVKELLFPTPNGGTPKYSASFVLFMPQWVRNTSAICSTAI